MTFSLHTAVLGLILCGSLRLSAQSIVASSGAFDDVSATPPTSLLPEVYESGTIRGFYETTLTLVNSLSLDYVTSGSLSTIAAGTQVSSFMFHFDGDENLTPVSFAGMTVKFDSAHPILGIIFASSGLDASDPVFGLPGTTYPTFYANRGLEMPDTVFTSGIANDGSGQGWVRIASAATFTSGVGQIDEFRIILGTASEIPAIPEPANAALAIGSIALGLVARLKRARSQTSVT